jgi:P pilus assembly chaperone PapD
MGGVRRLAAALVAAVISLAPLGAFSLEPMSLLVSSSGAGSIATFKIKNDGGERIAVKLSVLTRSVTPEGKEENAPAGNLFAIYPARVLVEPGASSVFKVQWKGPANLEAERCFRVVAEQISLSSGGAQESGIKILLRYIASLYVGSESNSPDIMAKATGALGPEGETGFLVEVANAGARHVVALNAQLVLGEAEGGSFTLSGEELGLLSGANYLPGQPRRLFIKSDKAVPERVYEAHFTYEAEY